MDFACYSFLVMTAFGGAGAPTRAAASLRRASQRQLLALRGYLLLEQGVLSFVSQLHQQYFRMCHREFCYEAIAEMPQDICKFLKEAIQRMCRKQIADSQNVNKHHQVLKRHYQNEFYR